MNKHNVDFSKETYENLNKSMDKKEMDQFLRDCSLKNKLMENELNTFLIYEKPKTKSNTSYNIENLKKS